MKRIILFVLLFAALKVAGQTTGYLRFDTVRIMKQNGTCELYIINKTKDSAGILTNVGGGLTEFRKSKKYNDTCLIIGKDTICGIGGSGAGGTSAEGIRKNSSTFELGDVAGTNTVPITVDRYLRAANKSIYFQGNKTHLGVASHIFDDTLTATAGNPKAKYWAQYNSLDHVAPAFYKGVSSVHDGVGPNNHIMIEGFNLSPLNTRVNSNYAALGTNIEGAYQNLQEYHIVWVTMDDAQRRLYSITADTALKTVDQYHRATSFELKDVDTGEEVWAQFTGGNGGTNTSFYLMSGSTNQYNLQYGFGVGGGNTSASIVTTGPGNKSFSLDSWSDVQLPRFSSFTTYNEFEAQAIPNADGTLNLGNPTNRWQKISGMVGRSANGVLIGDYSADQDPVCALEINKGAPSSGQGQIQLTNALDDAITGFTIKNTQNGHVFGELWANTASNSNAAYILRDKDNPTTNFSTITLTRASPAILGLNQNDLLINNGTDTKDIAFSTTNTTTSVKMKLTSGGNFLVGTTTDGGERFQVDGTSRFTSAVTGTNSTVTINNTSSGRGANISVSSGVGVNSVATSGIGLLGQSTDGVGVWAESTNTNALYAQSPFSGGVAQFSANPSSTNTTHPVLKLSRLSTSAGANNIAGSVVFEVNNSTGAGSVASANTLVSKLTTATAGAEVSQFEIHGMTAGASAQRFTVKGTGQLQGNNYGTGAFTGTPATRPVFESDGDVIEEIHPKIYTALISQSGTSNPTVTVQGTNTIGTIVWTRNSAGNYTGTLSGAFTADKTWIDINDSDEASNAILYKLRRADANTVTLITRDATVTGIDGFTNVSIEIRVYP